MRNNPVQRCDFRMLLDSTVIEKIINTQERKRKHSLRNIMNAILYLLKTGCQWRMIPKDFAPWESVYY